MINSVKISTLLLGVSFAAHPSESEEDGELVEPIEPVETSDTEAHGWSNFWDYALDAEGPNGHSHDIDPSLDGHCIACVGARRIFCLDGDENNENVWV